MGTTVHNLLATQPLFTLYIIPSISRTRARLSGIMLTQSMKFALLAALLFVLGTFSRVDALAPTVIDKLRCGSSFSILKAAITKADLMDALTAPEADITLFAPTNTAFLEAAETLGITAEELLDSDSLADILKYHVVPGKKMVDSLQNGDALPTLFDESETLKVSTNGEDVMINDAEVLYDDLEASNGVVHVINSVLLPPAPESVEKDADMELVKSAEENDVPILG